MSADWSASKTAEGRIRIVPAFLAADSQPIIKLIDVDEGWDVLVSPAQARTLAALLSRAADQAEVLSAIALASATDRALLVVAAAGAA